jgi:hypothetical protein
MSEQTERKKVRLDFSNPERSVARQLFDQGFDLAGNAEAWLHRCQELRDSIALLHGNGIIDNDERNQQMHRLEFAVMARMNRLVVQPTPESEQERRQLLVDCVNHIRRHPTSWDVDAKRQLLDRWDALHPNADLPVAVLGD